MVIKAGLGVFFPALKSNTWLFMTRAAAEQASVDAMHPLGQISPGNPQCERGVLPASSTPSILVKNFQALFQGLACTGAMIPDTTQSGPQQFWKRQVKGLRLKVRKTLVSSKY